MAHECPKDSEPATSPESHKSAFRKPNLVSTVPSITLDLSVWYNNFIRETDLNPSSLEPPLQDLFDSAVDTGLDSLSGCFRSNNNLCIYMFRDPPSQSVLPFFKSLLLKYVLQKTGGTSSLLENFSFLTSLMALCLEIRLFIKNETEITFEDMIASLQISVLDFWKQLSYFLVLFKNIPSALEAYLKELSLKIVTQTAWNGNSDIYKMVSAAFNNVITKAKPDPIELSLFGLQKFFQKLIVHVSRRIKLVCTAIGLNERTQECIWEFTRYFLSDKTEYLRNRNVEMVIVCGIYLAFKLNCEIRMCTLVDKYKNITGIQNIAENPRLNEVESISWFFEKEYFFIMKKYVENQNPNKRISALFPEASLKEFCPNAMPLHRKVFMNRAAKLRSFCNCDEKYEKKLERRANKEIKLPKKKAKFSD